MNIGGSVKTHLYFLKALVFLVEKLNDTDKPIVDRWGCGFYFGVLFG
jgi:hypothetical protein